MIWNCQTLIVFFGPVIYCLNNNNNDDDDNNTFCESPYRGQSHYKGAIQSQLLVL